VASLPYITRYYNPEEFGVFAVFSAIIGILVVFSTGKVEFLIITMKSKDEAVKASSLAKGYNLGPPSLHPWQI
jgi:O-antigen/teichoic acid export membrane protein